MKVLRATRQKLPQRLKAAVSAVPPKAAATVSWRRVRYGPLPNSCTAAITPLFDHLVGERENFVGNGQTNRAGGFSIDDQFELCGILNRQIGKFDALEDFIDVGGRLPKPIVGLMPVGHETTIQDVIPVRVDCR